MQHWQNAQVLVLLEQTPGGTTTNVPGRHLRPHSISGLSICSPHGDVYPQISAQAWLQNVQTPMLFPTGHYVVMGQCDSLVNYVTPAHTAAGGTGSVSDAESAKLSLAAQIIWSFCLSVSLSSKKYWNTKLVALKRLNFLKSHCCLFSEACDRNSNKDG